MPRIFMSKLMMIVPKKKKNKAEYCLNGSFTTGLKFLH